MTTATATFQKLLTSTRTHRQNIADSLKPHFIEHLARGNVPQPGKKMRNRLQKHGITSANLTRKKGFQFCSPFGVHGCKAHEFNEDWVKILNN